MDRAEARQNAYFTILVLGGGFAIGGILEDFLRSEGYPVLLAESAEDALAKTRRFEPSLILLDCDRKGVPCLILLPELLSAAPSAAVILLGDGPDGAGVSSAVEAMNRGAADFFTCPLDFNRLKSAIDRQKALFKTRFPI